MVLRLLVLLGAAVTRAALAAGTAEAGDEAQPPRDPVPGAAGAFPAPEGRELLFLDGTTLAGDGPGVGLLAAGTGDLDFSGVAVVAWTAHPLRLALTLPVSIDGTSAGNPDGATDGSPGAAPFALAGASLDPPRIAPPRLDARLLVADRRRNPLGLAFDVSFPVPFLPTDDPTWRARVSAAVGGKNLVFAANVGVAGAPRIDTERVTWGLGAALPIVGPLTAFAELDGGSPFDLVLPRFGAPVLTEVRGGLHLAPVPPLVLSLAVAGAPTAFHPAVVAGAVWIAAPRRHAPRTSGLDRDHDGIPNTVDACPTRKEDLDGGNNADGCPDAGATGPALAREVR